MPLCTAMGEALPNLSESAAAKTPQCSEEFYSANPEQDLHVFRTQYLGHYPIIYLPESVTAEALRIKWPFLWSNIQAILVTQIDKQQKLGIHLRETLARWVVVEGERSLDLLLGLLTHMAWAHVFARSGKPYLGVCSNIARTLVSDLRLDGLSGDAPAPFFSLVKAGLFPECPIASLTLAERRILIATFIMSTCLSGLLTYECMRWGRAMEQAVSDLSEKQECPQDEILVAIARIARISGEAAKVVQQQFEDTGPALLHIKPFHAELERLKAQMPNKIILSYLHNAEITVYSITFIQTPNSQPFNPKRYEYLFACLEASKSSLDNYLSTDIPQQCTTTFYILMHTLHGIQALQRLTILDDEGWDITTIQQTADVKSYLERVLIHIKKVHAHVALQTGAQETIWSAGVQRMQVAIPRWIAGMEKSGDTMPSQDVGVEPLVDPMMLNAMDDAWFTDIFASTWNI